MTVEANAKINLTLEVYGRREDGYHELRSVVLPIALADVLTIEPSDDGSISSDSGYGERDLIVQAAKALRSACHADSSARFGASVHVEKRIPVGAGLGGGSADAAATLHALNELWGTRLSPEELAAVGASVGSDVPALVLAQHAHAPVLMEGRGERVRLLDDDETKMLAQLCQGDWIVLANPGVASSTAEVYAHCTPRSRSDALPLFAQPVNDLQAAACKLHPEIATTLAALVVAGTHGVMMSGSGSTVFGFAESSAAATRIATAMGDIGCKAWITRLRNGE